MSDARHPRESFTPTKRLTPRQFEIVAHMWHDELNYEMIAARLDISERTVMAHIERIAQHLPGHGQPAWKVLRHAEKLLEHGFGYDNDRKVA